MATRIGRTHAAGPAVQLSVHESRSVLPAAGARHGAEHRERAPVPAP
ncbi:hypothetical protein ACF06V_03035 [Streptomyces bobili]|nr:hypothetical protein [Streptomyces galilaeus]